jgi:hypothetical protein
MPHRVTQDRRHGGITPGIERRGHRADARAPGRTSRLGRNRLSEELCRRWDWRKARSPPHAPTLPLAVPKPPGHFGRAPGPGGRRKRAESRQRRRIWSLDSDHGRRRVGRGPTVGARPHRGDHRLTVLGRLPMVTRIFVQGQLAVHTCRTDLSRFVGGAEPRLNVHLHCV